MWLWRLGFVRRLYSVFVRLCGGGSADVECTGCAPCVLGLTKVMWLFGCAKAQGEKGTCVIHPQSFQVGTSIGCSAGCRG
ncbi:hypothetical protein F4780DRAFT_142265 [Xylariomycetidae sp. FL0641]|nr:hypothetical protein F4780DRAFT_142265 [Xylariomycetidae sp. FL0641]